MHFFVLGHVDSLWYFPAIKPKIYSHDWRATNAWKLSTLRQLLAPHQLYYMCNLHYCMATTTLLHARSGATGCPNSRSIRIISESFTYVIDAISVINYKSIAPAFLARTFHHKQYQWLLSLPLPSLWPPAVVCPCVFRWTTCSDFCNIKSSPAVAPLLSVTLQGILLQTWQVVTSCDGVHDSDHDGCVVKPLCVG